MLQEWILLIALSLKFSVDTTIDQVKICVRFPVQLKCFIALDGCAICISGVCTLNSHMWLPFQRGSGKWLYIVLYRHVRRGEGDGERAWIGMRNWAVMKNLRYKDNDCLIYYTKGKRLLNSWTVFAVSEYGVRLGGNMLKVKRGRLVTSRLLDQISGLLWKIWASCNNNQGFYGHERC